MMFYFIAPLIAWVIAGALKYIINFLFYGSEAGKLVGNGGFPSNHTTIMTATTSLIGFEQGWDSPIFGLGVAVTLIVIFDATGLRRHVGKQAQYINKLSVSKEALRERIGHNAFEISGGLVLGFIIGYALSLIMS
jgi:acid phosphatase family membrane protein YuiD